MWYKNSEGRYGARGAKGDLGEAIVEEYCKTNDILFEDKNDINSQVILKIDCIIDGVAVVIEGTHYCVKSRGVEDHSSSTLTAKLGGCFKSEPDCRAEFMSLIKK